ncbi:hypothetical protein FSP39_023028 [Pinctada imbricata]|uniref:Sulfotransferase domain-containing protein n=1 Tax=Pinctada imbricata TaxID=66713 RepID=A0AA88XIF0_PINIB|nr:hypothetical protein FSP39_023028 [Pinctada imbricata]
MTLESYLREGRFQKKCGDVEFDFVTIDGIGLCPFEPARAPGGYIKRLNDIMNLDSRPDDVIMAIYPKCGTHWTYEILSMILQEQANYKKDTKMSSMLEALPNLEMLERLQSPRVLNTHLPYKWLPRKHIQNGGKIIYTTRNPKDAYVSFYHHMKNSFELGEKSNNVTWEQFFETCVLGKDVVYGSWFDYAKEMELAKKTNENIYTVHYENMKQDPETEIKEIAAFLGVQLPDSLVKEIAVKCHFKNLKKAEIDVKEYPPEMVKAKEEFKKLHPEFKIDIHRKGIVGDWKNHFTVAQNEQFDALYDREMKDANIKVIW